MFAIYAESDAYVHLVSATSSEAAFDLFMEDIESVGLTLVALNPLTVYAVIGNVEDVEMEDRIIGMIKKVQEEV